MKGKQENETWSQFLKRAEKHGFSPKYEFERDYYWIPIKVQEEIIYCILLLNLTLNVRFFLMINV